MQDRVPVVVQKEIWWAVCTEGVFRLFKMQARGTFRDRTRNPMDLRSAASVLAGKRHGFDSCTMLYGVWCM